MRIRFLLLDPGMLFLSDFSGRFVHTLIKGWQ